MRLRSVVVTTLVTLPLAGCGGGEPTVPSASFDPSDPRYETIGESDASDRKLIRRAGHRSDFRVPRSLLVGLAPGPLAHAAAVRMWYELPPDDPGYRRLNAGQRALFALLWADYEILNGGFYQLWVNPSGYLAPDLADAARRVGAQEYAAVFSEAAKLFPGGLIPRDRAKRERLSDKLPDKPVGRLDQRYLTFQYHRKTALGVILGRYVKAHMSEFAAD